MNGIKINGKISEGYKEGLKGRIYKLLPLREEKGEWLKFLDTIITEMYGGLEDFESINYIRVLNKLNFLKFSSFYHFRRSIFECMDLIDHLDL